MPCVRSPRPPARTLAVLLAAAAASRGRAEIIVVQPGGSVQAAIVAAQPGDEVVVLAGTYNEPLDLLGKPIILRSADGAAATVLSAAGLPGALVSMVSGETSETVLDGFTLRDREGGPGAAAALVIAGASPSVRNCVFTLNGRAMNSLAGAATVTGGSPHFVGCGFVQNGRYFGGVGGLKVAAAAQVTLESCVFQQNRGDTEGAAVVATGSTITLLACEFDGNYAWNSVSGAIAARDSTLVVQGCGFTNNGGADDGTRGGACTLMGGAITVLNSRFVDGWSTRGAGLYITNAQASITGCEFLGGDAELGAGAAEFVGGTATIAGCAFRQNECTFGGPGCVLSATDTEVSIRDCDFFQNRVQFITACPVVGVVRGSLDMARCRFDRNEDAEGGAVRAMNTTHARVASSSFTRHFALAGAAGVTVTGGTAEITNCLFAGNIAIAEGYFGAGGLVLDAGQATVTQCAFIGNHSIDSPPLDASGGLFVAGPTPAVIRNCIFTGNTEEMNGTAAPSQLEGPVSVEHCLVQGGWPG